MTKSTPTTAKKAAKKAAKAAAKQAASFPLLTSQTRVIRGITLPWKRVERTGPMTGTDGTLWYADHAPKGTVLESGEVFIELNTLYELSEQGQWDSQFGSAFLLGAHEGYALVEAGFAVKETRGGFHGTERLNDFISHINDGMGD